MNSKTGLLYKFDTFEKLVIISSVISAVVILIALLVYLLCAPSLIEKMYYGKTFDVLNNLIQYQDKYSLDHYLMQGSRFFERLLFLGVVLYLFSAGLFFLIYRLVFSNKKAHLAIAVFLPALAVFALYCLNPSWRIYSNHGFYRAGIVYQIMNGHVPPLDPLFDGYTVHSPWGFLWVIAGFSKFANISPFYSFALSNIICIVLTSIGVYKVAGLLYDNHKLRIFAVLCSIYAITPFPHNALISIQSLFHSQSTEWRATPIFPKYMTINGNPVGIVLFLIFLYAIIKLLTTDKILSHALLLFLSFVGAGFLYAPVLPGLSACLVILALSSPFSRQLECPWKKTVVLCIILVVGGMILGPYISTISSGARSGINILSPRFVYKNTINFLAALSPMILIILFVRKQLISSIKMNVGYILVIMIISLALCFISIHIIDSAEYKAMGLAGICLGILGGGALGIIARKQKLITVILLFIFFIPSAVHYQRFMFRIGGHPLKSAIEVPTILEKDTEIYVTNTEEAELYDWIKQYTSEDQLFIDTTLKLPIFAQRRLLVGVDREQGHFELGYSIPIEMLRARNGYNEQDYESRKQTVRTIYGFENTLARQTALDYLIKKDVLILLRKESVNESFSEEGLVELFRSSNGSYVIFDPKLAAIKGNE